MKTVGVIAIIVGVLLIILTLGGILGQASLKKRASCRSHPDRSWLAHLSTPSQPIVAVAVPQTAPGRSGGTAERPSPFSDLYLSTFNAPGSRQSLHPLVFSLVSWY
jgi:hypothetical protein